jgi:hypothetical protein
VGVDKDPLTHKYVKEIMYGYLEVEVRPDGSLNTNFRKVDEQTQTFLEVKAGKELTDFCFSENRSKPRDDRQSDKPYECK